MRHLAILLMGLLVLPVHASVKADVFSTEVALDESDADAEKAAKVAGFKQVIVKTSGDKNAPSNPVVVKASRQSGQYLSQISYGELSGLKSLKMVFNPPQIQSLLRQAELPYWSEQRSNIIVWVVEDSRYSREILWEQSGSSIVNQIKYFSDLRGLPITIPVGDIDDVTGITAPELWGGFVSPISSASLRYPGDAVLVVRIQQRSKSSQIRWTLYDEEPNAMFASNREPLSGSATGQTYSAIEQVIDEISNYYASKSAVKTSGELAGTIEVQFLNIVSANRFFALEKLLKEKNSVASVHVEKIVGDDITYKINLLSSMEEFEDELLQSQNIQRFVMDESLIVDSVVDTNTESTQSGVAIGGQIDEVQPLVNGTQEATEQSIEPVNPTVETVLDLQESEPNNIEEANNQNTMIVFEWVD